jgi:putative peptidoglycan binding protein
MKNLTSLLIGCSLTLAGAALAQQPVEQQSPSKGKRAPEKTHATETKPGPNAAKPQERPAKQTGARKERGATTERGATNEPGAAKARKTPASQEPVTAPRTDVSGQQAQPVSAAGQQNVRAKGAGAAKKPEPQQVQQVKSQHTNFRAQPKPQQVPAVTFNQNYRIQGSEQWQGSQYEVFRSYHPEWHDQGWYRSRYNRVELIGGGYYFFNNGYWYPAWGYDPSAAYYAYDAPIYVGHSAEPPDQVIADVQALLQQMGYYKGEVDGLLGPLTREALAAYQADQGLTTTAVIDEPTLDSLGLA